MNVIKKAFFSLFNRDIWLSTLIEGIFWLVFFFAGGYIMFILKFNPYYKSASILLLAAILYVFYGITERQVFKKIRRKPPL